MLCVLVGTIDGVRTLLATLRGTFIRSKMENRNPIFSFFFCSLTGLQTSGRARDLEEGLKTVSVSSSYSFLRSLFFIVRNN